MYARWTMLSAPWARAAPRLRRAFALSATALVTARAPSEFFDLFPSTRPLPAGPTLDISFASGALELSEPVIADWIMASARTIAAFYGRFPVDRLEVRVLSAEGSGVRSGSANADAGAALKITL